MAKGLIRQATLLARSSKQDIDNGAGATVDEVILRHSKPVKLQAAQIVYEDATSGTVAAATVQLGVAVGGATVAAATALENSKAVGTKTDLTLLITQLAANIPLCMRYTGIAATAAGMAHVEVEYTVDE
jgi:hypothetical protein